MTVATVAGEGLPCEDVLAVTAGSFGLESVHVRYTMPFVLGRMDDCFFPVRLRHPALMMVRGTKVVGALPNHPSHVQSLAIHSGQPPIEGGWVQQGIDMAGLTLAETVDLQAHSNTLHEVPPRYHMLDASFSSIRILHLCFHAFFAPI